MEHMHGKLAIVWEGLGVRSGAESVSKVGRKPKDAVKVTVMFSTTNGQRHLDNVSVSKSDIGSADGSKEVREHVDRVGSAHEIDGWSCPRELQSFSLVLYLKLEHTQVHMH